MTDALIENLEDRTQALRTIFVAREDIPWYCGSVLHDLSREQIEVVVRLALLPGEDLPPMGRFWTYAEVYPWFPDEDQRDDFPQALVRSQTLTWSHHLMLYVTFLTREPPDRGAAEEWLQRAEEESWKVWQLRTALGGGDPTPIPHITVKVPGKVMSEIESDCFLGLAIGPRNLKGMILKALKDPSGEGRRAVASLLKEGEPK